MLYFWSMAENKHTVATDALATLGTIIDESGKRDAIHLAVEPAIAGEDLLLPGMDVGIVDGKATAVCEKPLGIVDPFLTKPVRKGERFWLIIYPRTITSLRHVWEHPDIAGEVSQTVREVIDVLTGKHKQWLQQYAEDCGSTFEKIMVGAKNYLVNEESMSMTMNREFDDEFWDHYAGFTGEEVPEMNRGSFFSCSC